MRTLARREARADAVAESCVHDGVGGVAEADGHGDARRHEHARGLDLGDHAARADDASHISRDAHDALVDALDAFNQVRAFDLCRVRVVEPVDVGEDHHELRLDKACHERRERVVVAEANLLDRHRVVLVHDGHDPHLEQAGKRVARMEIRRTVGCVAPGQKHKRRSNPMLGERAGVTRRKRALPHRGRCLQARHVGGPSLDAERLEPARDGRTRHDDGRETRLAHTCHLAGDVIEERVVDLALRRGERRGADLDHERTQMGGKLPLADVARLAALMRLAPLARCGNVDPGLVH